MRFVVKEIISGPDFAINIQFRDYLTGGGGKTKLIGNCRVSTQSGGIEVLVRREQVQESRSTFSHVKSNNTDL